MSGKILFLLGALWVSCAITLLFSYEPIKYFAEPFMMILGIAGFIISVYEFFSKSK
ncbi:MAG TPA: hypothetical protein PK079_26790 [Leptospiraceae bacterium]|nr:hypothetical protein [Leptospiraceae bacterium]HMW07757.1 hypothetical protein [Leptospiraceae bacterium]HMZ66838.1 hypothetical protein [Leptospiraceae bacterium]HNC59967.1 hypothetical protein [Leptospiraceae bacterium]HNE56799.1 hypothetical protein [Leptospiraceae bacterium]